MSEESRELLRSALNDSAEMKEQGNKFFLDKNWTSAITAYNQALACLPKPKPPAVSHAQSGEKEQEPVDAATDMQYPDRYHREENEQEDTLIASKPDLQLTPIEQECSNTRVVLYANIAACELKLEAWEPAVKAATAALDEDPHHHKSLWRRAKANEAIDSWSSLTLAEKDYKTLTEIVPSSQPLYRDAASILRGIGPRIEAARKRDTDKMVGQLKEVGDSVLGWFGLSTDNFKMTPNGEGGYSMNFVSNP